MKSSLVLIGSVNNGNNNTLGTGILISFNFKEYLVTCKHIIFEEKFERLFAIPNPRMTKSLSYEHKILSIGSVNYHPEDTDNETFDIAVCEIINLKRTEFQRCHLSFIQVHEMMEFKDPENEDDIIWYGYPVDYTEKLLALNKNDRLPPFTTSATVFNFPIQQLPQNGFITKLKEGYFAQNENKQDSWKGISGGLVTIENNHCTKPYGVILGSTKFTCYHDSQKENYNGIVFAKFKRVKEVLQTLKRKKHPTKKNKT